MGESRRQSATSPAYRGRFAPSPTGPLHFGSLVAAVASFTDARHAGGRWSLRIDDVDETRTRPGAEDGILRDLEAHGLYWDGPITRQTGRRHRYAEALDHLRDAGLLFRCNCSRKRLAGRGIRRGLEGPIYDGHCLRQPPAADMTAAFRVHVDDDMVAFEDRIAGRVSQRLSDDVGDFVVRRVDGLTAYQLAVVIDDAEEGINEVVRGADLLASTPRQIWLQHRLGLDTPRYAHVPLVYDSRGRKLSKRDAAKPITSAPPLERLKAAWEHLGQQRPPSDILSLDTFWTWAIPAWRIEQVQYERDPWQRRDASEAL